MLRAIQSRALFSVLAAGMATDPVAHPTDTAAALIPTLDFARRARVMSPRLSPDGSSLGVRTDDASGDQHALVVYRLANMSPASSLRMPKYELPANVAWVRPTRFVVGKGKACGSIDKPLATGE